MSVDGRAKRMGFCCWETSRTRVYPCALAYVARTSYTFEASVLYMSWASWPPWLRRSSASRSSLFFFSSMTRALLARSASLRVAACAWSCLVRLSISSFWDLRTFSWGWYFFCRSAKLRWPSLVWATATWKAMTAILLGPAGAGAAAGVWAATLRVRPEASKVASTSERFMGMGDSFKFLCRIFPATAFAFRRGRLPSSEQPHGPLPASDKSRGCEDKDWRRRRRQRNSTNYRRGGSGASNLLSARESGDQKGPARRGLSSSTELARCAVLGYTEA